MEDRVRALESKGSIESMGAIQRMEASLLDAVEKSVRSPELFSH